MEKSNKVPTVAEMYDHYLKLTKQDPKEMNPIQVQETRKAFFGGVGIMLTVMRDDIGDIEDEMDAVMELEKLHKEVGSFWESESARWDREHGK